jgi:hypothetical protein
MIYWTLLWGCVKSKVYVTGKPNIRQQSLQNINGAAAVRHEMKMQQNVRHLVERHLITCSPVKGSPFENLIYLYIFWLIIQLLKLIII